MRTRKFSLCINYYIARARGVKWYLYYFCVLNVMLIIDQKDFVNTIYNIYLLQTGNNTKKKYSIIGKSLNY